MYCKQNSEGDDLLKEIQFFKTKASITAFYQLPLDQSVVNKISWTKVWMDSYKLKENTLQMVMTSLTH